MVFSPFSITITSLGEERTNLSAFRTFVRFVLVCACLDLSVSSSSWGLGRAAVCDCGTPWIFLLPFLVIFILGDCVHVTLFRHFFKKETRYGLPGLVSCTSISFWKGVYSKRKEFAPMGSKFSPFRIDPFSEGRQNIFILILNSPEMYQFPLNRRKHTKKSTFKYIFLNLNRK